MRNQQIYIDGVVMDIDDDTNVTLSMKSNLLVDVKSIESNHTYTVTLPKTIHNISTLDFPVLPSYNTAFPFKLHHCRYYRNGLEVIADGRATVLNVGDRIEISIYWGLFPALTKLQEEDVSLNGLEDDAHLMFYRENAPDNYSDSIDRGYFYASYVPFQHDAENDDWAGRQDIDTPSKVSAGSSTGGTFGSNTGSSVGLNKKGTLQPSVTVNWVLGLIRNQCGVTFTWDSVSKAYIDTLAIPLIQRKADEKTLTGELNITFDNMTRALGKMSFTVNSIISAFGETVGEKTDKLTVKAGCTVYLSISATWGWDASNSKPQGRRSFTLSDGSTMTVDMYSYPNTRIIVTVVSEHEDGASEDSYTKTYLVGVDNQYITSDSTSMKDGRFVHTMSGSGKIELQENDVITFTLENTSGKVLKGMTMTNGKATGDLGESSDVPYGGLFPIAKNLPDVPVLDFIKTLCLLTGTFPRQVQDGKQVTMARYSILAENKTKAVDWSGKLIPMGRENVPRNMEFSNSDGNFCRHNRYKWKEDDTVKGSYDADFILDNDTFDYEKDVWTLPFAASDADRIPILTPIVWSGQGKDMTYTGGEYNECKDRITNIIEKDGKASLSFNIDLQKLIDEGFKPIKESLEHPRVVTEYFMLTDIDLIGWNDIIPVYLSQYGAYFAVLEMKASDNYTEVKLLKIYV